MTSRHKSVSKTTMPPGVPAGVRSRSARQGRWPLRLAVLGCLIAVGAGVIIVLRSQTGLGPAKGPRSEENPTVKTTSVADGLPENALCSPEATTQQRVDAFKRLGRALVDRFPDSAEALTLSGHIHQAFGDPESASRCFQKCLELHPEYAEARCAVGWAAWARGEYADAVNRLQTAFAETPNLADNYLQALADSLMQLGKSPEAIATLEKARSVRGLTPDHALLLGKAYLQVKECEKAKTQLERVLVAYPRMKEAHYMLATALSRLGDSKAAAKHREEFARLQKELTDAEAKNRSAVRNRDFRENLPLMGTFCLDAGAVFAKHGCVDEAEEYWLASATLNPRDPEPFRLLTRLYQMQGRRDALARLNSRASAEKNVPKSP